MRVILPTTFPESVAKALRDLGFDIQPTTETSLKRLFQLSGRQRRIVFVPTESRPETAPGHKNAHGIIAIGPRARTLAGFKRSVIPHLQDASEYQFERHITYFHDRSGVQVMHLVCDDKEVQERISIPRGTNESFLHSSTHGLRELLNRGILLTGFTRTAKGYFVERNPTKFHLLGIVIAGRLELSSPGSDARRLESGCTFIIPSGSHCAYWAGGPTEFLWLHIHTNAFQSDVGDAFTFSDRIDSADLIEYCGRFRLEARNPMEDRDVALEHLAALIELAVRRRVTALGINLQQNESFERLKNALHRIEDNLAQAFSVNDLARLAGVSTSRLYRDAERHFGQSPGTLIEEIRIRHARELLLHADYKLEKIAEMTGYSDAFSFSRAFKRLTGKSPSAFRKEGGR